MEGVTGRLSAGWLARPLTFFELDHGLLNNGFDIGVTKLEKAEGVGGSLSVDRPTWDVTRGGLCHEVRTGSGIRGHRSRPLPRPVLLNDPIRLNFLDVDVEASGFRGHGLNWAPGPAPADSRWIQGRRTGGGRGDRGHRVAPTCAGPGSLSGKATWPAPRI